jgi:tetratricopeptide (TPR) repeat protein
MVTALAAVYVVGAVYFFRQERWARDPSRVPPAPEAVDRVRHPDAVLGALHDRFARQRFGESELALVKLALDQAPSFYQAPYFLASYHASRLENPATVRAAYEAAVDRYPANGRLHLAYAIWLLESRGSLAGWRDPDDPTGLRDPLELAEAHLARSMELEHDLSWRALQALRAHRVPPERWVALTPDDALSQRHLIDALFRAEHYDIGVTLVRDIAANADIDTLKRATKLALDGGRAELALDLGLRWRTLVDGERGADPRSVAPALAVSRAYVALGDSEASNRVLEETLVSLETKFGPTSRVTLDALCELGNEYLSRGQTFSAESFFAQAVSRSPSYVPALIGLGRSLARAGELDRAILRYEEALGIDPDNQVARNELRQALARASRR